MSSPPFFPLADEPAAEPLDLTTLGPTAPQAKPEDSRQRWIKLALLAPLLAKGGPTAITGFLQGWNQSTQQKQQAERQAGLDAERQRQIQAQEQYRQETLAGQTQTRQQALLKQYSDAVSAATTPEEVQAIKAAYLQQAQAVGMRPGPIEALAGAQTPDKLLTRRISATWAKLPNESKQEALKNGWSLNVDGQAVPFEQWSQTVGGVVDPATGKPPVAAPEVADLSKSSIDVQAAAALARGDTEAYQRLKRVADEMSGARQQPPQPPIQVTVGGSGLTQPQITAGSGLRDDYRVESKDFYAARDGYERMVASATDPSPAGDVALLYGFMKLLDPNSVVRETEFATAARTGSLPQQIQAAAERVVNGQRLTAEQRADFMGRARGLYDRAKKRQQSRQQRYTKIATDFGLPSSLVVAEDDTDVEEPPAPPPSGATAKATAKAPAQNPYRGK